MALIDDLPRSADARAHDGGAVILAIPREVVEQLLGVGKPSSERLLRLLCGLVAARLREVDEKLHGWHLLAGGAGASLAAPTGEFAAYRGSAANEREPHPTLDGAADGDDRPLLGSRDTPDGNR
jgi:hypothetical protein